MQCFLNEDKSSTQENMMKMSTLPPLAVATKVLIKTSSM